LTYRFINWGLDIGVSSLNVSSKYYVPLDAS
jgi:hypothetical protein